MYRLLEKQAGKRVIPRFSYLVGVNKLYIMKNVAFALFSLFALNSYTQTTFVNENFNAGIPGSWFIVDNGCPAFNWYGTIGGFNGNYLDGTEFAYINSDTAGFCEFDDRLVTPAFDATGVTTLMLGFDHYYRFYTNDSGNVDVFDGATWVTVATFVSTIGAWNAPDQQLIDISPYINANMQVRFRYMANWDWWWAVDNVVIGISVGILESPLNTAKEVIIHPNPTTGKFRVESLKFGVEKVEVFDLFGRKVLESKESEIDMSSYPAGLYIWQLGTAKGKLVKE